MPTERMTASPITPSNENRHVSLDVMHDLWDARWGNNWVPIEAIVDDEFFRAAYTAMKEAGEIEMHYLTDRARYVCRRY